MTSDMNELEACQVTDADRVAAWALWEAEGVGESMSPCWLEAFARHRIEAERAAMREAAEIVDELAEIAKTGSGQVTASYVERIAQRLRHRIPSSKDQSR